MHLKLIVFLAAVAACSATGLIDYQYGLPGYHTSGYIYHIEVKGDHIIVTGQDGTYCHIYCDYLGAGERLIHVHLNGHDMDLKTFQFVDHQVVPGVHQWDVLYKTFIQFVGHVDEQTFLQLLHVCFKHVVNHEVHPVVLQALHYLHQHVHQHQGVDILSRYGYQFDQDFLGLHGLGYGKTCYGVGCQSSLGHGFGYGKSCYGIECLGYGKSCYGVGCHSLGYAHQGSLYGPYSSDVYSHKGCSYGYGCDPHKWWKLHGGDYKYHGGNYMWNQHVGTGFYGHHYAQPGY